MGGPQFALALRRQIIVVSALVIREIHTRYGRENLGFVWLIIEPLLLCFGVLTVWTLWRGSNTHGLPVLAFVISGYIPLNIWRHTLTRSAKCIRSNSSLLYHRQVRILDLLYARIVLEFFGAVGAFICVGIVFWALDLYEWPRDWGLFYQGWLVILMFSAGCGLIVAGLTEIFDWAEKLVPPLMLIYLPASGVFFMLEWLPKSAREFLIYLPSVNGFEMIRGGQFGAAVHAHYDLGLTALICSIMVLLGMILCRDAHRHLVL